MNHRELERTQSSKGGNLKQFMTVTLEEILKYDQAVPRYTSYPTAPMWDTLDEKIYRFHLEKSKGPLSLYFHIPFCKTMCLYCGCSVILNRKKENEEKYVRYLLKEISLLARFLKGREVKQIHFGGGTPTQLDLIHLHTLFNALDQTFHIDYQSEIAIEIDPRTVFEDDGEKLKGLKEIGFNRVSFGVQDLDPKVQEAIKRRQTEEMTKATYYKARQLGFSGINMDLIYGLPFQTVESFSKTLDGIIEMSPDRIALFSYAKVPWLKPHQNAMKDAWLPSTEEKFGIYLQAKERFQQGGYISLGMDHFAKKEDELAKGLETKKLQRNFQGYTLKLAETMIPLGVTAVGDVSSGYFQNVKELEPYYAALDENRFPIGKGLVLSDDDRARRWVIHTLMCNLSLSKNEFQAKFGPHFDTYFQQEISQLIEFERDNMLINNFDEIRIIGKGSLFIRNIVSSFDIYYNKKKKGNLYSKAI